MSLQHELLAFHQVTPARLNRFANLIDLEWLEQALHCIGNPLNVAVDYPSIKRSGS